MTPVENDTKEENITVTPRKRRRYDISPKPQHREVLDKVVEKVRNGELVNKKEILKEVGYSEAVQNAPSKVFGTVGFKKLLDTIPDEVILSRLLLVVMNGEDRDAINAGKELLKVKDRYPANKVRVESYDSELEAITEEV